MDKFNCRFCGTRLNEIFVDLGIAPVSNANVPPDRFWEGEVFYPLRVYVCSDCFLVQLPNARPREEIFNSQYAYFSSYSAAWLDHARAYANYITGQLSLNAGSLVVEVASNDGYLLQYFKDKGVRTLGVEPSANVAEAAVQKGIPTVVEFFGASLAKKLLAENYAADLIVGNNVLAHVPDVNDFVAGLKILLKPDGTITMEFPHILKLIQYNQFDTIYHEHYSYFSLLTAKRIFASHGLDIFDVEELDTHGGSLRIFACHSQAGRRASGRVAGVIGREREARLDSLEGYRGFPLKVEEVKRLMLNFFLKIQAEGKRVAGYGAPAKGNILLNYCGVRTDMVEYTVDLSPHKQGLMLPGTRVPIYHPDKIRETRPDYVLILPWNLRQEIETQLSYIKEWGGKFVVAVPKVEIF